jgi:hypothetical protein
MIQIIDRGHVRLWRVLSHHADCWMVEVRVLDRGEVE